VLRAAAVIVSVAALGACGVGPSHTVDTSSLERLIATELAARYPVGEPTVTCTKGVRAAPGTVFYCSTEIEGQPLRIAGKITDHNGHFTVTPTAAIIDTAHAESLLQQQIAASTHTAATVDCGPRRVLVVAVGHTFSCQARLRGQPAREVTVTVDDLQGHVRVNLPPLPPGGTSASTTPS
jgi:hypothetical protein